MSDFYYECRGRCPICCAPATFVARESWLRDHLFCQGCGSLPRQRALIQVIDELYPHWPSLEIYEASPSGPGSDRLARECSRYLASYCYDGVALGTMYNGFRCEDLERLTYQNESFDLIVTQEVFEHVFDYRAAFREVMRAVRPGGAHIFTTPKYQGLRRSEDRAVRQDGQVRHLSDPEYHGNPIDNAGSLVTVHYGDDICEIIWNETRCATTVYVIREERTGTMGAFMDVFVTRKV